jgi:hypothetical protein
LTQTIDFLVQKVSQKIESCIFRERNSAITDQRLKQQSQNFLFFEQTQIVQA